MPNELLFIAAALIDLAFIVFLARFGRGGLMAGIVVNLALVSTFGGKLTDLVGLTTNAGNVFYGVVLFGASLLTEHFGRREGYLSVRIGFVALLLFVLMGQFVLWFAPTPDSALLNEAIKTLFSRVPRVAAASMIAYLVSQHLNVWFFDFLHQSDGQKRLWLRTILAGGVGQVIDSVLFFSIAFMGTLSAEVLFEIIYVGFLAKLAIAFISIPFMYWSYYFIEERVIPEPIGQIERESPPFHPY